MRFLLFEKSFQQGDDSLVHPKSTSYHLFHKQTNFYLFDDDQRRDSLYHCV